MEAPLSVILTTFSASLILTFLFQLVLWKGGFYSIPPSDEPMPKVTVFRVLQGFLLLFAIQFILIPGLLYAWFSYQSGEWLMQKGFDLTTAQELWFGTLGIYVTSLAIVIFALFSGAVKWGSWKQLPQNLTVALLGCLSALSIVFCINQIIEIILYFTGPFPHVDQLAVRHLKAAFASPELFFLTVIGIVTFVPAAEEILFRGLLQRWVVQKIGRTAAILFTAIAFASFHFSLSQGWDNIQLMISLSIVGAIMGFVYERQRAILAPILLHSLFNILNVIFLLNGGQST